MKKEIEFHEVTVTFQVREREVFRVAAGKRGLLAGLIQDGIGGNDMNCLDAENVRITIDGVLCDPQEPAEEEGS